MKIWVISDTHFGHDKLHTVWDSRPADFTERLFKGLKNTIQPEDVLIHLGDFCIGNDADWHGRFLTEVPGKHWLVKGNHDRKSHSWYVDHWWDSVSDSLELELFKKRILFTHIPVDLRQRPDIDVNIHGHFHNTNHRSQEPKIQEFYEYLHHELIAVEYTNYQPVTLESVISKYEKRVNSKEIRPHWA